MSDILKLIKNIKIPKSKHKKQVHFKNNNSHNFSGIFENEKEQRSVVKARFSEKLQSHKKFLHHYMTQEDKDHVTEKPELFGNDSFENYEKRMTNNHYKFIISPENTNVPLKEFAYAYMDCISKMLKKKFDWQGIIHTDTEHPHIHILINGKTIDGKKLYKPFPPSFIKKRGRELANELLTKIMGERDYEEIMLSRDKSLQSLRFTKFDKEISSILNGSVILNNSLLSEKIKKRLSFLTKNNICQFQNETYIFRENWEEVLRNCGRYNTYLSSFDELKFTVEGDYSLYKGGDTINGVIRKVYTMNDEDIWNNAVVIENEKERKAWYVPLFNPNEELAKNIGNEVKIESKQNSKGLCIPKISFVNEEKKYHLQKK